MGFLGTSDGRSSMRSTPVQLVCRPQRLGNASHDAKTYRLQDPMLVPKVYAPECAERLSKKRTFLRADGSECLVARPLAASTGLGAHPAVLHVHLRGVVLALLGAQSARLGARLEGSPSHSWLEVRLPREDPPSRGAHVRAVKAHGDAAPHMADHFLTEAGISAGATRLGAVEACLYALHQGISVHDSYGARIGVEHFPGVSHLGFPFPRTCLQCNKARKRSAYSPECVEGKFRELRVDGVLGSCAVLPSQVGYSNARYVGRGSSSPLRPTEE